MNDRPNTLTLGNFTWNVDYRKLERIIEEDTEYNQQEILLTNKQFRLLQCLLDAHPNVLEREKIVDYVWESKPTSVESLPQLINRTRQTLEDNAKQILVNAPGVGYSLNFTAQFDTASISPHVEITTPTNVENPSIMTERTIHSKNLSWFIMCIIAAVLTMTNVWFAAETLYYRADFLQVLQTKPYPYISPLDNGKFLVEIDDHECIYDKSKLLLKCP